MDSVTPPAAVAAAAPPSLLRHRSFVLFWGARTSTNGAYQMQAVAVGWQLYDLTHNPLDLGLVGLERALFRVGGHLRSFGLFLQLGELLLRTGDVGCSGLDLLRSALLAIAQVAKLLVQSVKLAQRAGR